MTPTPTLRDLLIARLTDEFGPPKGIEGNCHWSIQKQTAHAPINLALDSVKTPESIRLWIFDPELGANGVRSHQLTRVVDIEPVISAVRAAIGEPES